MFAIFKREFLSYFRTPVGWIAISLLSAISGFYYSQMISASVPYVNINMELAYLRTFFIILIPIITMRLFAEEKKNGTDVLLYTMPYSMKAAVLGKFLAAMALQGLMLICVFMHIIFTVVLSGYVGPETWGSILSYLVLAALFISIGMLTSAMTENQIMSAVVCFVVLFVLNMLSSIAESVSTVVKTILKFTHLFGLSDQSIYNVGERIRRIIVWFDPFEKTSCFTSGVFKIVPLVFCLSFTAMFVYITYRVLEKKRWAQS